jgi:hypothetical protein
MPLTVNIELSDKDLEHFNRAAEKRERWPKASPTRRSSMARRSCCRTRSRAIRPNS